MALHNYGLECEYLGERREAANAYRAGVDIARDKLGETHQLT
jgi:hypothetical protein